MVDVARSYSSSADYQPLASALFTTSVKQVARDGEVYSLRWQMERMGSHHHRRHRQRYFWASTDFFLSSTALPSQHCCRCHPTIQSNKYCCCVGRTLRLHPSRRYTFTRLCTLTYHGWLSWIHFDIPWLVVMDSFSQFEDKILFGREERGVQTLGRLR